MSKGLISGIIVLVLIVASVFVSRVVTEDEPEVTDTSTPVVPADEQLASNELPQDALPLDELPDDYLEEQTAPVGSDVNARLSIVLDELHTGNSGDYVRQNFPDLEYLFDHTPEGQSRRIFPFFYYYSAEADTTFVICNINKTVAVCDGKQDGIIQAGVNADSCELARPFERDFI